MADINLTVGQNISGVIRLYDNVSNGELSATFVNTIATSSNPEFAPFSVNPVSINAVNGSGSSVGSGTVEISSEVTYTDFGNGVTYTEVKTVIKTFEVVGTPNGAHLDITFQ